MKVSRFPLWIYTVDVGSESYVTQASVSTFNFQAQALKSQISAEAVRQAKKNGGKALNAALQSLTEPYSTYKAGYEALALSAKMMM